MTIYPSPAHVSHSQITALVPTFANACALRWAFERRLRLPSKGSLPMEMGSCLDDGLNELLRPALMGREVSLSGGLEALSARLATVPDDLFTEGQREAEGAALVEALRLFHESHKDWHGQDVQFRFEVPWQGTTIVGVIDRIDADGVLVDHKLSRSQHAQAGVLRADWIADRRPQLALYLACLALSEGQEVGARTKARLEVCYVTAKIKTPQWTSADLVIEAAEQRQALEDAGTAVFVRDSGVYPARPGRQCSWCDYLAPCRQVQSGLSLDIVRVAQEVDSGAV